MTVFICLALDCSKRMDWVAPVELISVHQPPQVLVVEFPTVCELELICNSPFVAQTPYIVFS